MGLRRLQDFQKRDERHRTGSWNKKALPKGETQDGFCKRQRKELLGGRGTFSRELRAEAAGLQAGEAQRGLIKEEARLQAAPVRGNTRCRWLSVFGRKMCLCWPNSKGCSRPEPRDWRPVPRWVTWEGIEGSINPRETYGVERERGIVSTG